MNCRSAFWQGFWSGLAAPLSCFNRRPYIGIREVPPLARRNPASEEDALYEDMRRIGGDFQQVIAGHRYTDETADTRKGGHHSTPQ